MYATFPLGKNIRLGVFSAYGSTDTDADTGGTKEEKDNQK